MTRTLERLPLRRCRFIPRLSHAERPGPAPWGRVWCGILWALLGAGMVFCHGCHGDEDNELCAPLGPRVRHEKKDTKPAAGFVLPDRTPPGP